MKLTWYGHACFKAEFEEGSIVFDPYGERAVPGLEMPKVEADKVICSHRHSDHCAENMVRLTGKDCGLEIRQVATFHDEKRGKLRGLNSVTVVKGEGMTLAHLGDLGHDLSPSQIKEIGLVDILLVPVGGYYTIDAIHAKKAVEDLKAIVVVPMHYRVGNAGLSDVAPVDDFLKLYDRDLIIRLKTDSFDISRNTLSGIYVFPWPKKN